MLTEAVFAIQNSSDFETTALRVFNYQYTHNIHYQRFCKLLGVAKTSVQALEDIPFFPIEFFKKEKIICKQTPIDAVFSSSGTTGSITSKHYVSDIGVYENSFKKGFRHFYGDVKDYVILALLPSYLEREGSSLIYMVEHLIKDSEQPESGFYLNNTDSLVSSLQQLAIQGRKVLLIGVSFALLDLVEKYTLQLPKDTIVMETGGMKGRRKEIIRQELHQILQSKFGLPQIHSEYGMTELLSQGYSKGQGVFHCPPWMKVCIRDTEDPLTILPTNKTGGINIIDLANVNSCSFIATQDLGRVYDDGSFEVLGRFDHSDIRGCNLMAI